MDDDFKQEILIEGAVDTDGNVVMASGKIVSKIVNEYKFLIRYSISALQLCVFLLLSLYY